MTERTLTGYGRVLLTVYVCNLTAGAASVITIFGYFGSLTKLFAWVPFLLAILGGALVYIDAKRIYRRKRANVINAALWALLASLFVLGMPWYIFARRKKALATGTETPEKNTDG